MLSWIFLILILAAFVVIGTWSFTYFFGGEKVMPARPDLEVDLNAHNAQAVRQGDFGAVAFDVVPRGYRQDQVDALLHELAAQRNPHAAAEKG
ncbi:DivIVA domain-containing protein [Corynebacterium massiliense]|uniref:DivIVA domain-containing protein n=1 Tax=Corynebacterium massiliense DSM 45435 TaxID=1121364 RepID=A0ABY7U9U6_9CORY|nr:DivIVA domain-containing protein [Corynebacterium massiliense]WCZ32267.1 hypothetical protein CMASS_04080 [Corynebacterium massiliense DSM 45435]